MSDKINKGAINRRQFSQRMLLTLGAAGASASGLLPNSVGLAHASSSDVSLLINQPYSEPETLALCQKSTGVNAKAQYISSMTEMFAKLRAGNTGIHLSQSSSNFTTFPHAGGLMKKLDTSRIPNFAKLMPEFRGQEGGTDFGGEPFVLPVVFGVDSIAYRPSLTKRPITKIADLWDPAFKGKIGMPAGSLESLIVAGVHTGAKDPNNMTDDELEKAKAALIEQKPLVRSYWTDEGEFRANLASGEYAICFCWVTALQLAKDGIDVEWVDSPEEGALGWWDGLFITEKQANTEENAEAIYKVLDWYLSAEFGTIVAEKFGYRSTATITTEALQAKNSPLVKQLSLDDPKKILGPAHFLFSIGRPAEYQKAWDAVLAA